jgi:5,10-methylenetetrahydromethanopterin reductase
VPNRVGGKLLPNKFDVGLLLESSWSIKKDLELARLAEQEGYDTVWANANILGRDPFTTLTAIAIQTNRVRLGTNVIDVYIRHPVLIASSTASLNEISKSRFTLGLGGAYADVLNTIGLTQEKPLTRVRETIQLVRALVAGHTATFKGSEFAMNEGRLRFQTKMRIPIYLGLGSGPRMMRLAGELCDGAVISESTDQQYKRQVALIREGLEFANRDTGFEIILDSMISVGKNRKETVDDLRPWVQSRLAMDPEVTASFGFDEESRKMYMEDQTAIPEDYIHRLAISGTPDDCLDRIKELEKIGITGVAHRYPTLSQVKGVHDLLLPAIKENL